MGFIQVSELVSKNHATYVYASSSWEVPTSFVSERTRPSDVRWVAVNFYNITCVSVICMEATPTWGFVVHSTTHLFGLLWASWGSTEAKKFAQPISVLQRRQTRCGLWVDTQQWRVQWVRSHGVCVCVLALVHGSDSQAMLHLASTHPHWKLHGTTLSGCEVWYTPLLVMGVHSQSPPEEISRSLGSSL